MVVTEAPSRIVGESRQEAGKDKGKSETKEESVHQEDLDDIDEYLAFMSRKFSKLQFKRNPSMSKRIPSYRRDNQENKSFLIGPYLIVIIVELLGISPMNAGNPK